MPQLLRASVYSSLVWLVLGCSSAAPLNPRSPVSDSPGALSAASNTNDVRRAPGVQVEPLPPLPAARSRGSSAASVLVLAAPASRSQVNDALGRFFVALSEESAEGLTALFEPNAVAHFAGGASTSALGSWLRRFARADYRTLAPRAVFHPSRLDTFSRTDVESLQGQRVFPLLPDQSELLAQVTIDDPDIQLLGSRMSFVLKPHADGYRIRATFEELAP